ncbi:hypothetical protein V5799_032389 [Amblyomma americanum]|uniref:Uncharacterized protein n=1 Tax=Amblyomma americanum TaxID=6943 RepID=A0AAQ4DRB2_AMBAM
MHAHETRKSQPEKRLRDALERRLSNVSMDISTQMPPPAEVSRSRSLADNLPVATDNGVLESSALETKLRRDPLRSGDETYTPQPSAPDGVFPSFKRDAVSVSRDCVAVAVLVLTVATFYNGRRLPINQAGRGGHATGQPCCRRLAAHRGYVLHRTASPHLSNGTQGAYGGPALQSSS